MLLISFISASRFYRNKGKHGKETSTRSKGIRGSDTAEEGARTRRRSCTVKIPVSPCPSPTQYIECPERNCDKRYKHINGLRYHQAHAHLDNADGGDDKVHDPSLKVIIDQHKYNFHPSPRTRMTKMMVKNDCLLTPNHRALMM